MSIYCNILLPHIDDLTVLAAVPIRIQDDVTVASIELTKGCFIHWNFIRSFNTPNLQTNIGRGGAGLPWGEERGGSQTETPVDRIYS